MHANAPFGMTFFFFIQHLSEIDMPSALPRRYDVVLFVRLGTDHAIARIVRVFVPVLLFLFHDSPDTIYLTEESAVFGIALSKFRYLSYNGRVFKV